MRIEDIIDILTQPIDYRILLPVALLAGVFGFYFGKKLLRFLGLNEKLGDDKGE